MSTDAWVVGQFERSKNGFSPTRILTQSKQISPGSAYPISATHPLHFKKSINVSVAKSPMEAIEGFPAAVLY